MTTLRLENRTGRVIALGRLTLALFILVAVSQTGEALPARPLLTLAISLGYLVVAAILLVITWSNWWLEYRLGLPSHVIDMSFFLAIHFSTGFNVASPFFIFFVFLVLAGTARWEWRGAVITAVVATVLFASEAVIELASDTLEPEEYLRGIVRAGHLLVLSLMIGWFRVTTHSNDRSSLQVVPDIRSEEPPTREAVEYMAERLDAGVVALVWSDVDEPWVNIALLANGDYRVERFSPAQFPWLVAPELDQRTFLFDLAKRRALCLRGRGLQPARGVDAINPALAAHLGLTAGLAKPINTASFAGYFVAGRIDGLCGNDLLVAQRTAMDCAAAFARASALSALASSTKDRTRLAVARDLHDSIAQIMAGIGLKLRGIRLTAASAAQRDEELQAIEAELARYQKYIYDFIENLRNPAAGAPDTALDASLAETIAALREQWHVDIEFSGEGLPGGLKGLQTETDHLVREAVANAVRHGRASRIAISAHLENGSITLSCEDNGSGFARSGHFSDADLAAAEFGPRSIRERTRLLGGTVELESSGSGAIVKVHLPVGPSKL